MRMSWRASAKIIGGTKNPLPDGAGRLAQAEAIKSQVDASGGARYQLARQVAERFAEALEHSGVDVVPKVQISGAGGGEAGGGVMQALLTLLMSEKLDLSVIGDGAERTNA